MLKCTCRYIPNHTTFYNMCFGDLEVTCSANVQTPVNNNILLFNWLKWQVNKHNVYNVTDMLQNNII